MQISISPDKVSMGQQAAQLGIKRISEAIRQNGKASIIVATGASQFEILEELVASKDIDWSVVTAFHLDEYVDLSVEHPASFRKYLRERFVEKLPAPLRAFHYVAGDTGNPEAECERLGKLISENPIDVCFAGIGENAHLAFNDPPADFETEKPYLVVSLDAACRQQQFGEGWFPTLDDVPERAISMSIRQILKSHCILISCPDERKAKAVQASLEGPVTNLVPSSILQNHKDTHVFLDAASASLLAQSS
ncbi:MAG: glucosamine-6-phosphate deaminase [Chthoniobacterales bacterium]